MTSVAFVRATFVCLCSLYLRGKLCTRQSAHPRAAGATLSLVSKVACIGLLKVSIVPVS